MKQFKVECAQNVIAQIVVSDVVFVKKFGGLPNNVLLQLTALHPEYQGCETNIHYSSADDSWTIDIIQLSDVNFEDCSPSFGI